MSRQTIKGRVKTVTFRDRDNGYSVLKVEPEDPQLSLSGNGIITVVGTLPGLEPGDEAELHGDWDSHKKFGRQFAAESYRTILPTSKNGLRAYLTSHIKGIGPVYAKRIVKKYGRDISRILGDEPEKLAEIKGITKSKARAIGEEWKKDAAVREQLIKLSGLGITPNLALKIINRYGDEATVKIKDNPYRLAEDIWGVGFIKADKVARDLGFAEDSERRIAAALKYVLQKAADEGHLFLPRAELIERTTELASITPKKTGKTIDLLVEKKSLIEEKDQAVYLPLYYRAESKIARLIKNHLRKDNLDINFDKAFASVQNKQRLTLNEEQKQAVKTALRYTVALLTGGPGTGKSTTVNTLCDIVRRSGFTVELAAPTGRAAKRMTELTGRDAKTIHRLLKIGRDGKAYYNQDNPLKADFLIIDEVSMLDILLALRLFAGLSQKTHILLVGDDSQLPSVQAGNILADLIASGRIPLVRLTEIFRQAQKSAIIRNAHRINEGIFPEFPSHPTDFYFFKAEEAETAAELIVDLVANRIPREFKLDPLEDIQVLAPMHKTACGVGVLNEKLQSALNPSAPRQIKHGSRQYRVGDRIMQTTNNYEKEVFNGEIGILAGIETVEDKRQLLLQFDDRLIPYASDELNQLTHAYAVSIHKSQGSEYPAVVLPVLTTHYIMLAKNLLYTAVTRAKELVVLVGSKKAVGIAVNNDKPTRRYTMLAARLKGEI